MRAGAAVLLAALALWRPAWAETAVVVMPREGGSRLVLDVPGWRLVERSADGGRIVVRYRDGERLQVPERLPAGVRVEGSGGEVTVSAAPGVKLRGAGREGRFMVDVSGAPTSREAPRAAGRAGPAAMPAPVAVPAVAPQPAPASTAVVPMAAPVEPVRQEELGAPGQAVAPVAAPEPVVVEKPAVVTAVLPAGAEVGAAAFRRGGMGVVVLDRALALEPPAAWEGAAVRRGAVWTAVQVKLPEGVRLHVARVARGWEVSGEAEGDGKGVEARSEAGGLAVAVEKPGRSVAVLDPVTGGTLLVGTALGAGEGVRRGVRTPDLAVVPSWLGVVVEALSDTVELRPGRDGFVAVGGATGPLGEVAEGRWLDLPDEAAPALLNRLRASLASASGAAPRARSRPRVAAAEAYLALGMGPEAAALLGQVAAEDPQAAADARMPALAGIAAVVAGRLGDAAVLDDARLDDGPGAAEVRLWRGVRDRRLGKDTAAARDLGAMAGLAWSYPATLRREVWPEVAEAAVAEGRAVPEERRTPFVQAVLLERAGKVDEALAAWKAMQDGPDRLDEVRGAVRGAELRLAQGKITAAEAAAVLEREAYGWRGDSRELTMRLRAAELRAQSGGWRAALDGLREAEGLFPEEKAEIGRRKAAVFEGMLVAEGGGMSPLDVVLLASDYADCVPEGAAGGRLAALLADKLTALDLPARAIPVLDGLVKGAPAGPGRAEFGARLAQLLLDGGDAGGAAAALAASEAPGLSPELAERRGLARARVAAAQGDLAGAVTGLRGMGTAGADELRASLLAGAKDWVGSLGALEDLAARVVPVEGALDERAQGVLLREASAAVQAGDGEALKRLAREVPRMTGPRGDVLTVLTAKPVGVTSELPRAAAELKLARMVPQRVQELGGR